MNLPFEEKQLSDNIFIRIFKQETDSDELCWHRDHEDRIIESLSETDWKIQIDNEIPKIITKNIIPKNFYHRVIKGTGDLEIKLTKI